MLKLNFNNSGTLFSIEITRLIIEKRIIYEFGKATVRNCCEL